MRCRLAASILMSEHLTNPHACYGDEVMLDLGAGQINGTVMHADDVEIEISTDGGDTPHTFYIDDLVDIMIITRA